MDFVNKFAEKFNNILDLIARVLIVCISLLGISNIIARFWGSSIPGTIEWTEFLVAMAIALAIGYCGEKDGHIYLELFTEKLNIKAQRILKLVIDIICMVFLFVAFWRIILYANDLKLSEQVSMTTQTPCYFFVYVVSLGMLGYALVFLRSIVKNLWKGLLR